MQTEQLSRTTEPAPGCPFAAAAFPARPVERIYSVPRRYDLATLMAVTVAYGCLFGAMRACGAGTEMVVWTAVLLTAIGAAQAVLFGGQCPRTASMIGGMVFLLLPVVILEMLEGFRNWNAINGILGMMSVATTGALLGYLGGVVVGGVFLVAHYVRQATSRLARGRRSQAEL